MPITNGIADPDDPRIAQRDEVLERVSSGSLSVRAAAKELGISETWARQLLSERGGKRADAGLLRKQMLDRLATDEGRALYAKRKVTTEPVFGNIKANLRCRRFSGRGLAAAKSEWRMICAVHNLLKIRRHQMGVA